MKNLFYIFFILLFLPFFGCQEKVDPETEEEAIKSVIIEETDAFWKQDLVRLLTTLSQDDDAVYISIGSNGYQEMIGWDKNYAYYKKASTEDWSDYTEMKVDRSNWKITICGESAFAIYNQIMSFKLNDEPMETMSKEMRMLKKMKGEWKITLVQWIDLSSVGAAEAAGKEF
ncbi:MAG: hypothetical protein JSV24_05805 [Bacteroidales bacterium]|nr:MAG: hypothetical protein JSV24_05805 [Bacteroidales bacterium]